MMISPVLMYVVRIGAEALENVPAWDK